ncbi:MAG: hypothetical protein WCA35_10230 [Kovacikia sp.]
MNTQLVSPIDINTAARNHAFDFCLPLDPTASIRTIARRLWNIAEANDSVGKRFAAIQEKMGSGKPLISDEHSAIYNRLRDQRTILDLPTAPEIFRPLFVAAYLRAKQVIAQGGGQGIFQNVEKRLDQVEKLVDRLEPQFIGELLSELMFSARENPVLSKQLHQGAAEMKALAEELYGPDLSNRPAAVARASNNGGGSCTCCSSAGGSTQCSPCSCWIIVIIIIIIVVTK